MSSAKREVTRLLERWAGGDQEALRSLIPLVLEDLRIIARSYLQREGRDHSVEPTELINDVYLRLALQNHVTWENRFQFFAFSSELMRRLLVDHARHHQALKRRGVKVPLDEARYLSDDREANVLELDQALQKLSELDSRQAEIVEMRIFGGWTIDEIAEALEIGTTTVKRDWAAALCWLRREIDRGERRTEASRPWPKAK